jgi:hypothetical protein
MRLQSYRAASLALAVLILGCSPAPVQAPLALDPVIRPAPLAAPITAPASPNAPTDLQPRAYLPVLFNNYDPAYVDPFGVIMYQGVTDAQGLPQMQAAGSRWATTMLFWSSIEPNPPVRGVHTYTWDGFDRQAHNAQAAGINLFVLFTGNPAWAAQYPGGPVTDTTSLVDFVTAMAERYDGDGTNDAPGNPIINYWSFYAEPDNGQETRAPGGKGWWGNNPAGFAALLSQISPAIHAANPNAKVLIGGLAYDWFTTDLINPGPFVRSFLTNTLSALNSYPGGVPRYLDAVAFHYYPISTARWPTIREKALEIRGILDRNGAGALPLIVPEMGFWSAPSLGSSETLQAQTLVQMYVRGLSVGIQQMSWYRVFDADNESDGLFRHGNLSEPKPSYTAYGALTTELFGAKYSAPLSGAGVEGYVFNMPGGPQKTVVWASGQPSAQVVFHASCVRRVDYLGNVVTPIYDGNGTWDKDAVVGQITLQVAQHDPIYVSGC